MAATGGRLPTSGAQPLATAGAPRRHDSAAALGGHPAAEAVSAFAHELARLIGPLHELISAGRRMCQTRPGRALVPICSLTLQPPNPTSPPKPAGWTPERQDIGRAKIPRLIWDRPDPSQCNLGAVVRADARQALSGRPERLRGRPPACRNPCSGRRSRRNTKRQITVRGAVFSTFLYMLATGAQAFVCPPVLLRVP
jgi:hypothetical protein